MKKIELNKLAIMQNLLNSYSSYSDTNEMQFGHYDSTSISRSIPHISTLMKYILTNHA